MSTVILANGRFPTHSIPLAILNSASRIVCCDGSVEHIDSLNKEPFAIVGDLDSLPEKYRVKYSDKIHYNPDQESNDLTKSVQWCKSKGFYEITILAGTGKRDDHTIGNIGLLPKYCKMGMNVKMVTDFGVFTPLLASQKLDSFANQQVSIFSFNNSTLITTQNLKYPITNAALPSPWMGTLNQSLGSWFELIFEPGPLVVFQTHNK
ncbi:MAG: thiamine diphosphokinase [Tenuifilaceae bacterium]|nr:thiamine diphosphokinase [Tenuifilaceae bacterium]